MAYRADTMESLSERRWKDIVHYRELWLTKIVGGKEPASEQHLREQLTSNSSKDIGACVTQIARHAWTGARFRPHPRQGSFLANPGFVLKPEVNIFTFGVVWERGVDVGDEVFLKSSSNAGSFCGCTARVEMWL